MATTGAELNDDQLIAELREKFRKKYIALDSSTSKLDKFDERDVNRIWNDDLYALSFVHWKKGNVNDAVEMVAQVLEWRKNNSVTDLSVESIGQQYIDRGVCYVHGRGVDGTRLFCLLARLQSKDEKDAMRKVFMLWLERLQRKEPGKHVTFILDTSKTGMSNVDLGTIKFIIESFSTYFPDLLERIVILDMPWIMNAIWKVVKQWMSEEQRSRVFFCSRKDLHQFAAADQRTKEMAGTSDWTFSFPPFPDDLGTNFDFKNDPMNFKRTEKPELPDTTPPSSPASPVKQNGDVSHLNGVANMEGDAAKPEKMFQAKKSEVDYDDSQTDKPDKNRSTNGDIARSYSMKSIYPKSFQDEISRSSSKEDDEVDQSDEIALGNLLFMSPVSDLVFTLKGERLDGRINIRNPNPMAEEKDRQIYVAFKVKTTSPERYHVKPSIGFVTPGESVCIRIYLNTGYESSMRKDRFLLLYKPIPSGDDEDSFSHENLAKFWKKYSGKSSHFEHRVRVKIEESTPVAGGEAGERKRSQSGANDSSTPVTSFLNEMPEKVSEETQLKQQIALLNNKITRLESDTRWMRRRMRQTMGLLLLVIFLMLFILYEVTMISYVLSSDNLSSGVSCDRMHSRET